MKHYIIVKFRKDADQKKLVPGIRDLFEGCREIEGVRRANVFTSAYQLADRFDLMIRIDMKKEGMEHFLSSDLNRKWEEAYGPYLENVTVFDTI